MGGARLPGAAWLIVPLMCLLGVTSAALLANMAPSGRQAQGFPATAGLSTEGRSDRTAAPSASSGAVPSGALSAYRAPALRHPLANLDPGLETRGPRPSVTDLVGYQAGNPKLIFARGAAPDGWQLARPSLVGVRGYAGQVSVIPGATIELHLAGADRTARLDVFRIGVRDALHLLTVPQVAVAPEVEAVPRSGDGLIEEAWPVSYRLAIPAEWRPGVYLVKLTGLSGRDSYIQFVVRSSQPTSLVVVLPAMTYEAYNDYGGASLYGWTGGPNPRAYAVSFDRPDSRAYGAGLFFRLDFPLIVWLEDHGYAPGYVTDVDLARDPGLVAGTTTIVFSGHSEYWTGGLRDTMDRAAKAGTNLGFFGANQAFWQVRLEPSSQGMRDRAILSYKDARLDPISATNPAAATDRFASAQVNRPPRLLMGLDYGGIVDGGPQPMVIASGLASFAPDSGLYPGEQLPGLIGREIDTPPRRFSGLLVGSTPVPVLEHAGGAIAAAALWINPAGGRIFDAGTFGFSWGLDPRYAAALPGFPGDAFGLLMADVLAWLGAQPGA